MIIGGIPKKATNVDFGDLISCKAVLDAIRKVIEELPAVFAPEEKKGPRSSRPEDIDEWMYAEGLKKRKDRHHL